jgi:UPF0755 protein
MKHQAKTYLIPAVACLAAVCFLVYYYLFTSISAIDTTHYLYVDDDDNPDSVCFKLTAVASPHALQGLRTLMRHTDYEQQVHSGRYAVEPGISTFRLYRNLSSARQTPLMLTIPESRTMPLLAAALGRRLMADSASIAQVLTDSAECAALGYTTQTIAAMIVPNTYEVYWNVDVRQLLQRLKKEHDSFWSYDRRHKADALGLTPDEVCTVASIVDEETANNGEKPAIAGMYLNRLKEGMPLQADPTVKFAIGDFSIKRIYKNMLQTDSPYNTYKNTGLPPGPIKIASVRGIDAVLNRTPHDYLYMCAKEDFSGTHNFARTYQEHLQNAQRYAKALNERGIK